MTLNWPFLTGWDGEAEESDGLPFRDHDQPSPDVVNEFYLPFQEGSQSFVDLAASLAGVEVNQAAVQILRGMASDGAGADTAIAELGVLRGLEADSSGSQSDSAALGVDRLWSAEITGGIQPEAIVGIERALAAAPMGMSDGAAQMSTTSGEEPQPGLPIVFIGGVGLPPLDRPFVGEEDAPIWADDEEVLMML